jgi:hypothetical protein
MAPWETKTCRAPDDLNDAVEREDTSAAMELADDEQDSSEPSEHHTAAASELSEDVGRATSSMSLAAAINCVLGIG